MRYMIAALVGLVCACSSIAAREALSVSDLLLEPTVFDNRSVKVRACVASSPHGSYIHGCGAKEKPLVLLVPSGDNDPEFGRATALSQEHFTSEVRAIFTGTFHVRKEIDSFGERLIASNILQVASTSEVTVNEP